MIEKPSSEDVKSWYSLAIERLKSPFFFAFFVSWPLINYKFLVVLFSANGVDWTFDYIENHLYSSDAERALLLYVYPAIVAMYYNFCHEIVRSALDVGHRLAAAIAKVIYLKSVGIGYHSESEFQEKNAALLARTASLEQQLREARNQTREVAQKSKDEREAMWVSFRQCIHGFYATEAKLEEREVNTDLLFDRRFSDENKVYHAKHMLNSKSFRMHMLFLQKIVQASDDRNYLHQFDTEEIRDDPAQPRDMPYRSSALALSALGILQIDSPSSTYPVITFNDDGRSAKEIVSVLQQAGLNDEASPVTARDAVAAATDPA